MKQNLRSLISVILVSVLTFVFVSGKYEREYKLHWMAYQRWAEVTEFHVETDEEKMGLLNTSFDVNVKIKGTKKNPYSYVHHVQKAEYARRVEGEDELVVFVEFLPVFEEPLCFKRTNGNEFETNFTYTLNAIEYGDLVYVFRCGDLEEKIRIECGS